MSGWSEVTLKVSEGIFIEVLYQPLGKVEFPDVEN